MQRLLTFAARVGAPGWPGHLLAALGGVLVTLSLAPFEWWPLGIVGVALFNALLQKLTPRQAAARGWWFGAGLFVSGTSWVYVSIHDYGYAPVPLAAALSAGYCLGLALLFLTFAWVYTKFLRELPGGRWLGFAALWVLWEWLRAWLLTGFPWLYVGYAYLETPLAGWAPVLGVYGVSLFAVLTAAALASLRPRAPQSMRPWAPLTFCIMAWIAGIIFQQREWTRPQGEPVTVALVQANISQSVKWDPERYYATLEQYQSMSAPLWSKAQIVIWSEAAIPTLYDNARDFFEAQAAAAEPFGATLISGVPYREPPAPDRADTRIYNSAVALGNGGGVYHKQHLVPFGEFIPLERWLRGLIRFLDMPMSDFSEGPAGQDPLRAGAITLAPFICYEIVYPDLVRHARADVLLTLSNDAWFGRSIGPLQHLQMAQMRALENGRELIRATSNGVTALIDARGAIAERIPQFEAAVLEGRVQPRTGLTPYARTGSQPVLLLCALLLCALLILRCFLARRGARRDTDAEA